MTERISPPATTCAGHYHILRPALLMTVAWLLLILVTAFYWMSAMPSPITGSWRRWDVANQWHILGVTRGLDSPLPERLHMLAFAGVMGLAIGAYIWAIHRVRQQQDRSRTQLWLVLGGAAVMGSLLVLLPVLFSSDVFTYIFSGRISVLHHQNPFIATPRQFANDPVLPYIFWQDIPSVYGPVWLDISGILTVLASQLGGSIAVYVLLYKLVAVLSHLGNTALIWSILTYWAPERRLIGAVIYAWCPLALFEFAGSAHIDATMLFFFLLGLWLIARGSHAAAESKVALSATEAVGEPSLYHQASVGVMRRYEVLALGAWACSVATKYLLLMLVVHWIGQRMLAIKRAPRQSWYHLWQRRLSAVAWRSGIFLVAWSLLILPYWDGPQTVRAFIFTSSTQFFHNSLLEFTAWIIGLFVPGETFIKLIPPLRLVGIGLFAIIWLWQSRRFRTDFLTSWTWIIVGFLLIGTGWVWPWYTTWALMLVALRPLDRLTIAVLIMTGSVLSIYVLLPYEPLAIARSRALFAFGPAVAYLLATWPQAPWQKRVSAWVQESMLFVRRQIAALPSRSAPLGERSES